MSSGDNRLVNLMSPVENKGRVRGKVIMLVIMIVNSSQVLRGVKMVMW